MNSLKIMIPLLSLIYGCAELSTNTHETKALSNTLSDLEINERCEVNINEIEIFQVLEDGALANVCKDSSDYCTGMIVAIPLSEDNQLWDKKRIKTPKNKCVVVNGTYKYETRNEIHKTVPVIGFDYKYPPKNETEAMVRLDEVLSPIHKQCLSELKDKKVKKSNELCDCYIGLMKTSAIERSNSETENNRIINPEEFESKSKQICGKSPVGMDWYE